MNRALDTSPYVRIEGLISGDGNYTTLIPVETQEIARLHQYRLEVDSSEYEPVFMKASRASSMPGALDLELVWGLPNWYVFPRYQDIRHGLSCGKYGLDSFDFDVAVISWPVQSTFL